MTSAIADAARPPGLTPLDADQRLHSLDILRGLALLGMILVHFHQRMRVDVQGLEDLIGWTVYIFVEQKAWGTFAFLFGVGFAVLLRRLEARGAPIVRVYLRRMAMLAAFGAIAFVGFGFHILFDYACWGSVLLLVRRWSTRALCVAAALAASILPLAIEVTALHAWFTATPLPAPDMTIRQTLDAALVQPDYVVLLSARWTAFIASLPHSWRDLLPDVNLALFIIGMLAVRHRILDEPRRHVRLIAAWMIGGAGAWAAYWLLLRRITVPIPGAGWPLMYGFGLVQEQWLCFTYIGAVVLLLAYRPSWIGRLMPFGWAGRMALTNYMLQAAVLDLLGSGYGFGLHLRPGAYVPAAMILFGAEAILSRLWLARYRFGPLEWLWRSATYAQWQPLRRVTAETVASV